MCLYSPCCWSNKEDEREKLGGWTGEKHALNNDGAKRKRKKIGWNADGVAVFLGKIKKRRMRKNKQTPCNRRLGAKKNNNRYRVLAMSPP